MLVQAEAMGTTRTAWHILLAALLREFGPHRFEVRIDVPLSKEPLRVDHLIPPPHLAVGRSTADPANADAGCRGL